MSDPLREPGFLTRHQLDAIAGERNLFLTACPGSGKTRTAAVRLARLADDGLRVAGCSYTNVGAEALHRILLDELRQPLGPGHYLGTLHGFLLRFVLHPFGHLVTGAAGTTHLTTDTSDIPKVIIPTAKAKVGIPLDFFMFRPDGTLTVRTRPPNYYGDLAQAAADGQAQALTLKRKVAAEGQISPDDAMYWALLVLLRYPHLAGAVAGRFDELLVDEAQDTSELQIACLRALHVTGALGSLVLVGDLEQSIYSFQGANRDQCQELADHCHLHPVQLTENHRSSQLICDVAAAFTTRAPDTAVGATATCPWQPELILYPATQPRTAINWFDTRIDQLGIPAAASSILGRTNPHVGLLNADLGTVSVGPWPERIGRAVAAARHGTVHRRQIDAVDRILATAAWDTDLSSLDPQQRQAVRLATTQLLTDAPDLDLDLHTWISALRGPFVAVVTQLSATPAHQASQRIRASQDHRRHSARDAFPLAAGSRRAQTVHDIKGESRDAVLLVGAPRGTRRQAASSVWSALAAGNSLSTEELEELRIAYVAVTRPRRYLAVALPDNTAAADLVVWQQVMGFHLVTPS